MEKDPETYQAWVDFAAIALFEKEYPIMLQHLLVATQLDPAARDAIAQDTRFIDIRHWEQFQNIISPAAEPL